MLSVPKEIKGSVWMLSKNIQIVLRDRNCGHQESQGASRDSMVWYALRGNSHHRAVSPGAQCSSRTPSLSWETESHILHASWDWVYLLQPMARISWNFSFFVNKYYTKYLGSINCQANGFPFLLSQSLPTEMTAHTGNAFLTLTQGFC